jgi:hypothetical protein
MLANVETLKSDGFVILRSAVSVAELADIQETLIGLFRMQARKIGIDVLRWEDLAFDEIATALNEADPQALQEAGGMLVNTVAGRALAASQALQDFCSAALNAPQATIQTYGPHFRSNLPGNRKQLYTWHSEAHWYPKRRSFLNVWMPFRHEKRPGNGTMFMLKGSHTRHWDFAEFYGSCDTRHGDRSYLLQYDVPECEFAGLQEVPITAQPGDAVVFDRNTLHRSSLNASPLPSYTVELRVYDYRRDLTVAAGSGERPYTEASATTGRPQMNTVL